MEGAEQEGTVVCARFVQGGDSEAYKEAMGVARLPPIPMRYSVAPSDPAVAARVRDGNREAAVFRWGFTPPWSKKRIINAKAETVAELPTFRKPFRERRCLIPAEGFVEWREEDGVKQPYLFRHEKPRPILLAGLWDIYRGEEQCTVITVAPNDLVEPFHDRMAAILPWDLRDVWLDPEVDPLALLPLLQPYPADRTRYHRLPPHVNNSKYDGPDLIPSVA